MRDHSDEEARDAPVKYGRSIADAVHTARLELEYECAYLAIKRPMRRIIEAIGRGEG